MNNLRLIVPSSDVTLWAARGMLWTLERYWPTHPPVLISGYTPPAFPLPKYARFQSLGAFRDFPANKWSNGLIRLLESIDDPIICVTFDDFWLVREVPDAAVRFLADYLEQHTELARIDLTTDRANSGHAQDARVERYRYKGEWHELTLISTPPRTSYQLSFQAGLWRRSALLAYLTPGETAGETEVRGSNRMTLANANVMGTLEAPFKYRIVVQHGKVTVRGLGYQVPGVEIPEDDLAELDALGYTTPPQTVTDNE